MPLPHPTFPAVLSHPWLEEKINDRHQQLALPLACTVQIPCSAAGALAVLDVAKTDDCE
jgi:hypothetical protein